MSTTFVRPISYLIRDQAVIGNLKTAYDSTTPTTELRLLSTSNQAVFDLLFTPAANNTVLYVTVEFSQLRIQQTPGSLTAFDESKTVWTKQTMDDFANGTATGGTYTVPSYILERKYAFGDTSIHRIQIPAKCASGYVRLNLKADNPGASVLNIYATAGAI